MTNSEQHRMCYSRVLLFKTVFLLHIPQNTGFLCTTTFSSHCNKQWYTANDLW